MKIIVFAVLSVVAVGYAQPPPRPVIPETFQSKVDVMYYEWETTYGNGTIARDVARKEGVELIYAQIEGRNESRIRLERFDMGETYFIRGSGEDVHCEMRKTNSTTLPPYWGWVKEATYAGLKPFYEQMLQAWAYDEGPGVRFELLVSPGYPDIPQVLITELGSQRREIFLQRSISTLLTSVFLRCPKCASSSSKDCGQHAMWTL